MKIDCGFFDKDGNYKEDIQEVEVLSVKELNEIELIKAQNEGLKKQNAELQKENAILKKENYNKLIAWEELQADNEQLKKYIERMKEPELKVIDANIALENANLKAENERLKVCKDKYYQQTLDDEIQINELYQTLQEIKNIAENAYCLTNYTNKDMADFAKLILQQLIKAEEE